jgi:hypothetical protein
MKNNTYSRCNQTVSTVKKSTASILCALRPKELAPGETGELTSRPKTRDLEHLAHRCGRDHKAEPTKFTRDPLVTPAWVLTREAKHQLTDLAANRRPTNPTGIGPAPRHQSAVPAK